MRRGNGHQRALRARRARLTALVGTKMVARVTLVDR